MTNDTIQNFIDELRWRPIEEAPSDGTSILARIIGLHPDSGKPYQGTIVDFNEDLGLFIDETMQDQLYDDGEDYEMSSSQVEWCKSLAEWKPLPQTDTAADVMQIAINALRWYAGDTTEYLFGNGGVAKDALAQIEARIGERNDRHD
jgi:hypothetical protein